MDVDDDVELLFVELLVSMLNRSERLRVIFFGDDTTTNASGMAYGCSGGVDSVCFVSSPEATVFVADVGCCLPRNCGASLLLFTDSML